MKKKSTKFTKNYWKIQHFFFIEIKPELGVYQKWIWHTTSKQLEKCVIKLAKINEKDEWQK